MMTDTADLLPLVESFHIAERRLVWVTDDVCAFRSGCGLVFLNTHTRHQQLLHIPIPYILDAFAITPPAAPAASSSSSSTPSPQIAVALHGQDCVIRLYSFPQLELVQTIAAAEAVTAFTALTFTSHSHLLATSADSLHYYHCPSSSQLTSSPLPPAHAASAPVTLLLPCPFLPSRCLSLTAASAAVHLISALSSFQPPLLHHTTITLSQPLSHTSITTALWLSATSLLLCNSRGQLYDVDVREAAEDAAGRRAGRPDSVAQTALNAALEVQLPVTSKEVEQLGLKEAQQQQQAEQETETETAEAVVGAVEAKLVATLSSPAAASSPTAASSPLVALSSALTKQYVLLSTTEGSLLFLDPASCSPVLLLSVDSASPLACISFSPAYSDMLALSESGHLRLLHHTATTRDTNLVPTAIAAASAASSSLTPPVFSLSSLGHFTIAPPSPSSSSPSPAVSCSSCVVPCAFASASPRVSLVCSSSGVLEVWTYSPRGLLCSLRLPSPVTASTSSPDGLLSVLGLQCGTVCILSLLSPSSPRLIYTQRLHSSPVLQLQYEGTAGRDAGLLCSCSAEELWWLRAADLRVLGWVKVRELLNGPQGAEAARDKARMDEERRQREEDEAFFASLMQKQDGSNAAPAVSTSAAPLEPDAPLTFTWLAEGRKLVLASRQSQLLVLTAPPADWESEDELLLPESLLQPSFRRSDGVLSVLCRHSRGDRWYAGSGRDVLVYELKADVVRVVARSEGHYADVSSLCLSPCGRLLLSGGEDGLIIARNAETLSVIATVPASSFLTRGLSSLSASSDSEYLLSSARDGSSACWSLTRLIAHPLAQARYTQPLPAPAFSSTINPRVLENLATLPFLPADSPSFLSQFAPPPAPSLPEELVAQRETLLSALSSLTVLVTATRTRNAQLPSSATLPWSALVVDSVRRQELEAQSEREVAARAEEIEREHRGAELVCERIVSECWDSMAVKGAVVKGLKEEGEEVRNFGLRVRSSAAVWRMRQLQLLREMEICERRWRWTEQERQRKADSERERELHSSTGSHSGSAGAAAGRIDDPNYWSHRYCDGVDYILHSEDSQHADHQLDDDRAQAAAPGSGARVEPITSAAVKAKEVKKEGVSSSSSGGSSKAASAVRSCSITVTSDPASPTVITFAIPAFYLYHPLDVISPCRQRVQWLLLREKAAHCKLAFNALFADFHLQKQKDLATLSEKSRRVAEIAAELGMDGSGLATLPRYELEDDEVSENVLRVRDDELRAGRGGDKGDSSGSAADDERSLETAAALQEMMNGSVECKRDLSLLEAELTPAEWMQKPAAEMTEEEKAELLRFEKKVRMIETEREQRRKTLQTEMNKVRSDMQDIGKAFDYKVRQMREQRQRSSREVLLIDWYMQRLLAAQARERAWRRECGAVERRRAECERMKDRLQARMQAFRSEVETEQAEYEALLADVRQLEKSVRKEATDAGENYEHLCKLFRIKRIKFSTQHAQHQMMGRRGSAVTGQAAGAGPRHRSRASTVSFANVSLPGVRASLFGIDGLTGAGLNPLGRKRRSVIEEKQHDGQHDGDDLFASLSPYADAQQQQAEGAAAKEEEASPTHPLPPVHMCDLDTAPPDMNAGVWARFAERRRVVVEKEAEVKARLARLQDMHRFYMRMQVVEEWAISGMQAAETAGAGRQGQHLRACEWDVCLMLRLQQGLVELDDTDVVSVLSDVQLLGRAELSELNAAIRLKGQQKLGLISDMQTFSQQRRLLQWRHRMLQLQHEQALDVTTQLQLLRVTKDMQMQLKDREEGRGEQSIGDVAQDTAAIERKMDFVRAAVRSLNTDKQAELARLRRRSTRLEKENNELRKRVEMLKEAVAQRQAIEHLREEGEREREEGERRKMRDVVARRRLVDLARLQTEEISWLRGQVVGLRRKTFASFAEVKLAGSRRADEEKQQLRPADGSRKGKKEKRLVLPAL